jgi:hypothetical protein
MFHHSVMRCAATLMPAATAQRARKVQQYTRHVKRCLEDAEAGWSALPQPVLQMDGMSGTMTRHFYNCLLSLKVRAYFLMTCIFGHILCCVAGECKSALHFSVDASYNALHEQPDSTGAQACVMPCEPGDAW